MGMGLGQEVLLERYSYMHIAKSSLVLVVLFMFNIHLRIMVVRIRVSSGGSVEGCCGFLIWQGWQTLSVPAWSEFVSSGGAPTPAGTSVFTKHNWDMGMGYLLLNGWGIYGLMGGALWYGWGTYGLNGWGSYDKVSCCFVWKYAQKIAGLQGSTLSDHRMTTGFLHYFSYQIHAVSRCPLRFLDNSTPYSL